MAQHLSAPRFAGLRQRREPASGESTALTQHMSSNPSIEGMPKRLRLLCTPHVKR